MSSRRSIAVLAGMLLLAGCSKPQIEFYRVPKEADPQLPGAPAASDSAAPFAANGGGMSDTAVPTASGAELHWTAPARWMAKTLSAMRKGSYSIPGPGGSTADLSITAFPGDVGGELANVNRWRGQVQLPAVSQADLAGAVTRLSHNGLQLTVVEAASPSSGQRILGAIVPTADSTWFFKLMGPDAVVAAAKPEFIAFLRTIAPAPAP